VIISREIRSLPMLECSIERWVWAPHNLLAGTSTSPRLSVSLRMSVILLSPFCTGPSGGQVLIPSPHLSFLLILPENIRTLITLLLRVAARRST
jgi:hypothetical protein